MRKSPVKVAISASAALAMLVGLGGHAKAFDGEDNGDYASRYHDYHYGRHNDLHSGGHYGSHDRLHYDEYDGWHAGRHFGPHGGTHYNWHPGAHHNWYRAYGDPRDSYGGYRDY